MDRAAIGKLLSQYVEVLEFVAMTEPSSCDDLLQRARRLYVRWLRGESLENLQRELQAEWKRNLLKNSLPGSSSFEVGMAFGNLCLAAEVVLFPPPQAQCSGPSLN